MTLAVGMLTGAVLLLSSVWALATSPLSDLAISKLDSRLVNLVAMSDSAAGEALTFASTNSAVPGSRAEELGTGYVRITLLAQDMNIVSVVMDKVRTLSGTVEMSYQTWIQALVPIASLGLLAELPQVRLVRLPYVPHMMDVISQGVGLSGADAWQKAGFTGKGVKVGVIDSGFRGYRDLLGKELPPTVVAKSFCHDGQIEPNEGNAGDVHGLAVAEIIHDMAPEAQLFFAVIRTDTEMFNALDWLISQKVDVINLSAGFFTGCYIGNGSFDDPNNFPDNQGQIARVRQAGILWVTSAGNEAQAHWGGSWQDQDNNGELNFTPQDNSNTFHALRGDPIFVELSWDDPCSGSTNDYDLFLENSSGTILDSSTDRQKGRPSDSPREEISLDSAPYTGVYKIVVKQVNATRQVRFNLFAVDVRLTYPVAAGSLTEPAISQNAMTVGAVDWQTEELESFSSQGPTLDGRIKPDITGVDRVSNVTFDPFSGTSASSPQVAGAAALVKQAFPAFGPAQIQNYLEQHAEDLGPPGKDNQYGAGLLIMGPVPAGTLTIPAAPSDLSAQALSSSSIQLTWKDNSNNERGFKVLRDGREITNLPPDSERYTDNTGLQPNTRYCYRVKAFNDAGESEPSNEACTTTLEVAGQQIVLKFDKLEFLRPQDWQESLQSSCAVYTNVSAEASPVRVTLPGGEMQTFSVPGRRQVMVCGDLVYVDARA